MGNVILIFPPLVETNIGKYYASPAYLAGALRVAGYSSIQIDLNARFCNFALNRWRNSSSPASRLTPPTRHPEISNVMGDLSMQVLERFGSLPATDQPFGSVAPSFLGAYRLEQQGLGNMPLGDEEVIMTYREFFSDQLDMMEGMLGPTSALVGITVAMGPQLAPSLLLSECISNRFPKTQIVLGGPTFTLMNDEQRQAILTRNPWITEIVIGDGEIRLVEIASSFGSDRDRGNSWSGTVSEPHPAFDERIIAEFGVQALAVRQARGCYWGQCEYCDFINLYPGKGRYRPNPVERITDTMEKLVEEHGITRFDLVTEALPPAVGRRLAESILKRRLNISWTSFAMVDSKFDADILSVMRESGCAYLCVGLETFNTRTLRLMGKAATGDDNMRFLETAYDVGIDIVANIIPDFPSTTYDEALADLAIISSRPHLFRFSVFPFEPTLSSNVGKNPGMFGLIPDTSGVMVEQGSHQAQFSLNHFSAKDPAMDDAQRGDIIRRFREASAENAAWHDSSKYTEISPEPTWLLRPDEIVATHADSDSLVIASGRSGIIRRFTGSMSMQIARQLHPPYRIDLRQVVSHSDELRTIAEALHELGWQPMQDQKSQFARTRTLTTVA